MPSLDTLLGGSMLFTADTGNASFLAQPVDMTINPFQPPPAPTSAVASPVDQAIWSWTHDMSDVATVRSLTANVRSMGYMTMPVLERVQWGPVEIEDPITGDALTAPLEGIMLVRRTFLPAGQLDGSSQIWPLPANVDASLQLVFACEQDPSDPTNFIPPSEASMAANDFMPDAGGSAAGAPLRLLICCELVLCKEREDFEPLGILASGRVHPHVMLMSNRNLSRASVTVTLARPPTSGMNDPGMTSSIGTGLFTETNDNTARLSLLVQAVKGVVAAVLPVTPLWDNIFDYYVIDPGSSSFTVVDPVLPQRTVSGAIETVDVATSVGFPALAYKQMDIVKVDRQAAYDNIHMAPKMLANLPLLAPDPIAMAPGCVHDCLHIHWRWATIWERAGIGVLPSNPGLKGWNANNVPYSTFGAPQVPHNQRVRITVGGPASFDYQADCLNVLPGAWQHVFHHGGAYSLAVGRGGTTIFAELIGVLNALLTMKALPTLPPASSSWGTQEWARFYAVLRFQPSTSGPLERIRVINRTAAEAG